MRLHGARDVPWVPFWGHGGAPDERPGLPGLNKLLNKINVESVFIRFPRDSAFPELSREVSDREKEK